MKDWTYTSVTSKYDKHQGVYLINVWKTFDVDEKPTVVAKIRKKNKEVEILDRKAVLDREVNEEIESILGKFDLEDLDNE